MIHYHYDVVQGSQEWLDLRKGKVTCSNALTVMTRGVGACLKANASAAERLRPNGNAYAERGHVIEHEYKEEFNKALRTQGLSLRECGFITNDEYPNAGYSPDGLVISAHDNKLMTFAEFKAYNDLTTDKETGEIRLSCKHRNACRTRLDLPPECIAQCNMAMLLTGTNYMYLFLCNPDADRANSYIKTLAQKARAGDKKAEEILHRAMPDGNYEWEIPITKIWEINRDEKICNRIISGLKR